jgi:hypothetical protein
MTLISGVHVAPLLRTNDRDTFIEDLTEEVGDERQDGGNATAWAQAGPQVQREFRKLGADASRSWNVVTDRT